MIEVPRGALTADEIAQTAECFSFGTDELTSNLFGGMEGRTSVDLDIWKPASDYDRLELSLAATSAGLLFDPKTTLEPDTPYPYQFSRTTKNTNHTKNKGRKEGTGAGAAVTIN